MSHYSKKDKTLIAKSVLLVFHWSKDKRLSIETLPPLGILSIAAYLDANGIHTDVIDFTIDHSRKVNPELHGVIGFSINISNREISLKEIDNIKKAYPHLHIIVGGPLCMCDPELFVANPNIDAVFACEWEEALLEYLTTKDRSSVRGVYVRQGSQIAFSGERDWINDLDALPFPALDKVDIKKYNNYPKRNRPISTMMTSRGCPYGCIFCSHALGRKWRARSAEKVVEEIMWQVYRLGVQEICIYDDNFSLDRGRAERICDLIIKKQIPVKLQFANGLRVDNLDLALLKKMKRAGTWLIGLAPETGNPEVMKKIKKSVDYEKLTIVRQSCRELGIRTHGFFMIGFPFETRKEIEETVQYAKKLDCEIVEFNKVIPYPKTELYEILVNTGNLLSLPSLEAKSYHDGTITTHKLGDLEENEIRSLIKRAYREYYLRPNKILHLLRAFSIRDLLGLAGYAIRTRNI